MVRNDKKVKKNYNASQKNIDPPRFTLHRSLPRQKITQVTYFVKVVTGKTYY